MIIELQSPFKEKYIKGYLVVNPENRRNVLLYNGKDDRTTISYARYLMSVHLGYIISDQFHVDHIDNDKTNDKIENFQLLTPKENIAKNRNRKMITLVCPACKKEFIRERRQTHIVKGGNHSCCSRICARSIQL